MINIDTRFLDDVNADQLWLLCHIIKRADSRLSAYPSNKTLCKDTGWNIKKLQKIKTSLIDRGILMVKPRFNQDQKQTSSVYSIRTDFMGVYVPAKNIEVGLEGDPKTDTLKGVPYPQTGQQGGGSKTDNEVLPINEVLLSDSKESDTGELPFGGKPSDTGTKKPARACYAPMIDHWLKDLHKGWVFRAVHGKAIKSIIGKIEFILHVDKEGPKPTDEAILQFFKIMCQHLPEWFKDKDLPIIDSKFNEIVHQIQTGKKKDVWNSKPSSAHVFGKYAQQ